MPAAPEPCATETRHATCVAIAGRGALITGPSGYGKSGLALQLIGLGATLVSDDRTHLRRDGSALIATAPATLSGRIEARFVGILSSPAVPQAQVVLIVDLSTEENQRLPAMHRDTLLGVELPVIRKSTAAHFPSAVALYLRGGRLD
ncbi:MAG: HPr kinase/phosphatase C-terminal domain-containing protein [Pseudomonadota bacterium]